LSAASATAARLDAGAIDFGVEAHEFRDEYLDKRIHLQRRALSGPSFAWAELDAVLHVIEPEAPTCRLFKNGPVPEERYTDRYLKLGRPRARIDKRRFYAELRSGATLVINRFEDYSLRAKRLCGEVARFTARPVVGNAYLSVGGRGTFGRHWDTHDVVVLQLMGRKRWRLFDPTFPMPLPMHASGERAHECPDVPVLDCVLETGDLLYLPRGWWHEAIPFDAPSLHLSVGAYAPTVHDYLSWICARHLPDIAGARISLTEGDDPRSLASALEALTSIALDSARKTEFEREMRRREQTASEFNTELFLGAASEGPADDALVSVNGGHILAPDSDTVLVNGTALRVNSTCRDVLGALGDHTRRVDALYAALSREAPTRIRIALLDLAQHDIVTIAPASS
jgi:ribosomal protein L16 Arg81 hydroxylase